MERSRFTNDKTSVDLISVETPNQNTNIISSLSIVQSFVEGFNPCNLTFHFFVIAVELNIISDLNFALFNSTACDSSSSTHIVGAFHRHKEGFVDGSAGYFNFSIHGVEEGLDTFLADFRVGILDVVEGGSSDKC